MNRILACLVIVCSVWSAVADSIVPNRPYDGAVVSQFKAAQKLFLLLTEAAGREVLADNALRYDFDHRVRSFPEGVELSWHFSGDRPRIRYRLTWATDAEFSDARQAEPPHSSYRLYNLEAGRTYYWKAAACYDDGSVIETPVWSFSVEELTPRVMNVPDVDNFRDLGGRLGLEGRRIAQNKIYRSSGLNNNSSDGKIPGPARFTEEGRRIMLEELGLKTEVDLRSSGETAGMTASPLGDAVQYINISSTSYAGLYSSAGRDNYAALFRIFCDPENYPVNFHCIAGADRTGSLAFLREAILGVSRQEMMQDYVFTSFFTIRDYSGFDTLAEGMDAYGTAEESLAVKAERYLLQAGIEPEEIMAFRSIMLGEGVPPGPVLAGIMQLKALMAEYPAAPGGLSVEPAALRRETVRVCGKDYELALPVWQGNALQAIAGDGNGGFRLHLFNSGDAPLCFTFAADPEQLAAAEYSVMKMPLPAQPQSPILYSHDGGRTLWSAEELNSFRMMLSPQERLMIQVTPGRPAGNALPAMEPPVKMVNFPALAVMTSKEAPDIDGVLDDEIWQRAQTLPLQGVNGEKLENPPTVQFAADPDFNVLYLAARFPDTEIISRQRGRDSAVYTDDSMELFLSAQNETDYYQMIFNPDGELYDGRNRDSSWSLEAYTVGTQQDERGWTLELALPLAQFNFTAPLELNLGCSDYPAGKLANLFRTGGSFHNRSALQPVIGRAD